MKIEHPQVSTVTLFPRMPRVTRIHSVARVPPWTRLLGTSIALIGAGVAISGGWLVLAGGQPYYLLAALVASLSGVLLARGRMLGGWLYLAVVAAAISGAFSEVGPDKWALASRLAIPILLLVGVIFAMASLSRNDQCWRGPRPWSTN